MSIPPAYFPLFYPEDGENIISYNIATMSQNTHYIPQDSWSSWFIKLHSFPNVPFPGYLTSLPVALLTNYIPDHVMSSSCLPNIPQIMSCPPHAYPTYPRSCHVLLMPTQHTPDHVMSSSCLPNISQIMSCPHAYPTYP